MHLGLAGVRFALLCNAVFLGLSPRPGGKVLGCMVPTGLTPKQFLLGHGEQFGLAGQHQGVAIGQQGGAIDGA